MHDVPETGSVCVIRCNGGGGEEVPIQFGLWIIT
jgi:hypothetical protein